MRTAKEIFQSSTAFKDFQTMLASPAFEPACHAALQVMIEELPNHTTTPAESWDCHCQIVGAKKVLEKLSELHLQGKEGKKARSAELNYGAYRK